MLAANADRERAVDVLRAGFAEGRLTQQEFDERVAGAYASRTYGDLGVLTADLPAGAAPPVMLNQQASPAQADNRPLTSAASLIMTAIVVFTLAALVTGLAVLLHTRGAAVPAHHIPPFVHLPSTHLLPYLKPTR